MRTKAPLLALLLVAGCQLVASVDRDRIPDGGATSTSTSAPGGGGTGGAPSPCVQPADCPGEDGECRARTCEAGRCGFADLAEGTALAAQLAGDCQRRVCDGQGRVKEIADDTDPLDDGEECTVDTCAAGVPRNTPRASGSTCGPGAQEVCAASGACVACVSGASCGADLCVNNRCVPTTCVDGAKNGDETDVDCGGSCAPCDTGRACLVAADCASLACAGVPRACLAASCGDGLLNGDETDVDCGGSCAARCGPGARCHQGGDCAGGACSGSICLPSCADGVKDGSETGLDCGGACAPCPDGEGCAGGADCAGGACQRGLCVPASCRDGVKDGSETGLDCGGLCAPCPAGGGCHHGADCASAICAGTICAAPSCADGVKNGAEIGVDCGGPSCAACPDGQPCGLGSDCASGACRAGLCVPVGCEDGVKGGAETDVDCGGACAGCAGGKACLVDGDCASLRCLGLVCAAPSCSDGLQNGGETGLDCGGPCAGCALGDPCVGPNDCALLACDGAVCVTPSCSDGVHNGGETGLDCGGSTACDRCPGGQRCAEGGDCASGVCTAGLCDASCTDGVKDGDESATDCGGSCPGCPAGTPCAAAADCASRICTDGACLPPSCTDGVQNGGESDKDCGGPCAPCVNGQVCSADADCRSFGCRGGRCVEAVIVTEVRSHGPPWSAHPQDGGFTNEFVELYNPGLDDITLDATWQLRHQQAQSVCSTGSGVLMFTGAQQVLPAHHHILLQGLDYEPLLPADVTLTNSTEQQSIADGGSMYVAHGGAVIDALCFCYNTQNCGWIVGVGCSPYVCNGPPIKNGPHDGSGQPSSTVDASLARKVLPGGSYQDTRDSSVDFAVASPSKPQNLASPAGP